MARRTRSCVAGSIASRAWWAMLVLIHLPALGRVGYNVVHAPASSSQLIGMGGLALTVGFFVLKLIDVRFLRLGGPKGTVPAFILACAVVHHDTASTEVGRAAIGQVPAVLVTVLVVEALCRSDTLWRRVQRWFTMAVEPSHATPGGNMSALATRLGPPQRVVSTCLCSPRPPPAS